MMMVLTIISFLDEICAVLKLDSMYSNQTNWKPVARDAWEQEFRIELERVSCLLFSEPLSSLIHFQYAGSTIIKKISPTSYTLCLPVCSPVNWKLPYTGMITELCVEYCFYVWRNILITKRTILLSHWSLREKLLAQ